jgi:hypothetical protein
MIADNECGATLYFVKPMQATLLSYPGMNHTDSSIDPPPALLSPSSF